MNFQYRERLDYGIKKIIPFIFFLVFYTGISQSKEINFVDKWVIKSANVYEPRSIPQKIKVLIEQARPKPSFDQQEKITWEVEQVDELSVGDLEFVAFSYRPSSDVGEDWIGTIQIVNGKGSTLYLEQSKKAVPTSKKPSLILVKSSGKEIIFLKTYDDEVKGLGLRVFNKDGVLTSYIETEGRNEFTISDVDNDGKLEISGYNLRIVYPAQQNKAEQTPNNLLNDTIFPFVKTGLNGIYNIYEFNELNMLVSIRGKKLAKLYEMEAKRILPFVISVAEHGDSTSTNNAVAVYLGVLEGTGDSEIINRMYRQLPISVRSKVRSQDHIKFWQRRGLPGLINKLD